MLNYGKLDEKDTRIQTILNAFDRMLSNPDNIVMKYHQNYGGLLDDDHYSIWNNGFRVCSVYNTQISYDGVEDCVILPNNAAEKLITKLKQRCINGEAAKIIDNILLLKRLEQFSLKKTLSL